MGAGASGSNDNVVIYTEEFDATVTVVTVPVNQNAREHQVAINEIGSAGAAGTAAVTIQPTGTDVFVDLLESDELTPVVLNVITGDARSSIRGSLTDIKFTVAAFDGDDFRVSVASFF